MTRHAASSDYVDLPAVLVGAPEDRRTRSAKALAVLLMVQVHVTAGATVQRGAACLARLGTWCAEGAQEKAKEARVGRTKSRRGASLARLAG